MSCGKKGYITRSEAKKNKKRLVKLGHTITNIYYCEDCSYYHLTSMNKQQSRNITKKVKKENFKLKIDEELLRLRESVVKHEPTA